MHNAKQFNREDGKVVCTLYSKTSWYGTGSQDRIAAAWGNEWNEVENAQALTENSPFPRGPAYYVVPLPHETTP